MVKITCPACGEHETAPDGTPTVLDLIGLFRCNACSCRVVYGRMLPRVVTEPYTDNRGHCWIRTRYQDPKTKADLFVVDVDPQFAVDIVKNTLSLVQT